MTTTEINAEVNTTSEATLLAIHEEMHQLHSEEYAELVEGQAANAEEAIAVEEVKPKMRVIYSAYNLETALAALYTKNLYSRRFDVKLVGYDRVRRYDTSPIESTLILGAEMLEKHLLDEVAVSGRVHIEAMPGTYEYLKAKIDKLTVTRSEHRDEWRYNAVEHRRLTHEEIDLFTAISDNANLDRRNRFNRLDEDELSKKLEAHHLEHLLSLTKPEFVHANESRILRCLEDGTEFIPVNYAENTDLNKQLYITHRDQTRSLIQRSFGVQSYGLRGVGSSLPTASIPHMYSQTAIRLISFPHKDFVVYEDLKDCRVWRIVTEYESAALAIAQAMKPHDVWRDGRVLFVITDLPQIKVN